MNDAAAHGPASAPSSAPSSAPLTRDAALSPLERPWALATGGALSLAAANGVDRFIYTPILPVMASALELTASQAGLIASSNYLGYLLGALFAAWPRLPGSRRAWLLAALALSASCTAALGACATLPPMLVLRLISGFAGAVAIVMAIALVVERLAIAGRSDLTPVHFAGVGIGIAASALIVAVLRNLGFDWRAMWLCAGATSGCALAAVALLVDPDAAVRGARSSTRARSATPTPLRSGSASQFGSQFRLLIAANTLSAFGYVITATFIVALVRGSAPLRSLEASIWVVFGLAAVPSVALWLGLARRIDVFRTFALVCVVEAVGVFASVMWLQAAGTLVAALCVGGSFMGTTALGMLAARKLTVGTDARLPVALMTAGFGVGQMLGPTFAGALRDLSGSFLLPSLCAAASLLVASMLAMRAGATPR